MRTKIIPMVIEAGDSLVDNAELRAQLIERTEVLGKVKKLFLIPGLEMMTTRQVADFYEVGKSIIDMLCKRNKAEVDGDGVIGQKVGEFLRSHDVSAKNLHGKRQVFFDGMTLELPNSGSINLFTQRAILRIGMLLRDSEVAKEVRTQLLNGFKRLTPEQKVDDIDIEISFGVDIEKALLKGDTIGAGEAMVRLNAHKDRQIAELNEKIENITIENNALAEKHLTTEPRRLVNRIIKSLACLRMNRNFSAAWHLFANEVYCEKKIDLIGRKKDRDTMMDVVKDDEWMDIIAVAASMCNINGLDFAQIVNEVNAVKYSLV